MGSIPTAGTLYGEALASHRYRILTAQGKDAPGGAKSCVHGYLMTGGDALVAWLVRYGCGGLR